MSWESRLPEQAIFTDPEGEIYNLDYRAFSQQVNLKTAVYDFPGANFSYAQQNGISSPQINITFVFSGENYDLEIDKFIQSLKLRGVSSLNCPYFGTFNVVPLNSIIRNENVFNSAGYVELPITFLEVQTPEYSPLGDNNSSVLNNAIDSFNETGAQDFSETVAINSPTEKASLKAQFKDVLNTIGQPLKDLSDLQDDISNDFDDINDSVAQGLDLITTKPYILASQTLRLVQTPARILGNVERRLSSYGNLLSDIFSRKNDRVNAFEVNNLVASGLVSGLALSSLNLDLEVQEQAINASNYIYTQYEEYLNWVENQGVYFSLDDLQKTVYYAVARLQELSFDLKQEYNYIVEQSETILQVATKIYGDVTDETLNAIISNNALTSDELIELKKGKIIRFYK